MQFQRAVGLVLASFLLVMPTKAWSQAATGAIAGSVKDTSGAVLPGVTVEAASAALIEKTRSVVSDDRGEYRIIELRPGTYAVTFTLPGFATVRREGIELTTSFTANVNAELKVGGLEETITVSGETPVVDVSSARQQTTVGRAVLDAIPTTKRLGQYASFIPGANYGNNPTSQDSGGTAGEGGQFAVHGQHTTDQSTNMEGMGQNIWFNDIFSTNSQTVQEVVVETGATSAEAATGGVQVNIIPKDGGNTFSGSFSSSWTGPQLQNSNLTDELQARGLTSAASVKYFRDNGGSLGGPIKRDKLWFFTGHRFWATSKYIQGTYYNKSSFDKSFNPLFYTPDRDHQAFTEWYYHNDDIRVTWQAAQKHKIVGSFARQDICNCPIVLSGTGGNSPVKFTPEGARWDYFVPIYLPMVSWSNPATSRLLFEAASSVLAINMHAEKMPGQGPDDIAVIDIGKGLIYGSNFFGGGNRALFRIYNSRFAASYVTGSHTFKTGFTFKYFENGREGRYNDYNVIHGARSYIFVTPPGAPAPIPLLVQIHAQPFERVEHTTTTGIFAQDQWAVKKFTLNLGLRYDAFRGATPQYTLPRGFFVGERTFPARSDVPNYKNLDPRVSVIYDVFGDGKTALKASLGRYIPLAYQVTDSPAANQDATTARPWNDQSFAAGDPRNGNYVPDCNLGEPLPNGECGPWLTPTFGRTDNPGLAWDPDAQAGFNTQFSNWQVSTSVQHELRPGVALNVGYFRTWYGNFLVNDNEAYAAADFDQFCITLPTDSSLGGVRLPGAGGQRCGFYDLKADRVIDTSRIVRKPASKIGNRTEIYNGVDLTLTARFGQGGQFSGGLSIGRTTTDACDIARKAPETLFSNDTLPAGSGIYGGPGTLSGGTGDSNNSLEACKVSPPISAGTQAKFLVVYPLPYGLQLSAIYQNMPGVLLGGLWGPTPSVLTAASTLGRTPRSFQGQPRYELVTPGAMYEDRLNQLDLRFSRAFAFGKVKVKGNVDVSNVFNQGNIFTATTVYGANWLVPVELMGGRLARLTAQLEF